MSGPPRATHIVAPEDVPACPRCGGTAYLSSACLGCGRRLDPTEMPGQLGIDDALGPLDGGGLATVPMQSSRPCAAHDDHRPRVSSTDIHHVVPRAWGGSDEQSNLVALCPTGHRNVHQLLLAYQRAKGLPAWSVRQRFHPAERELARLAWAGRPRAGGTLGGNATEEAT